MMNFKNLDDFWAFYVSQHSKTLTRRLHILGTLSGLLCLVSSLLRRRWIFLLPAPIIGYAPAWYSHFFVEGNFPATFGHPFWSFLCDLKMFAFMLSGGMDKEIKRLGKPSSLGFLFS